MLIDIDKDGSITGISPTGEKDSKLSPIEAKEWLDKNPLLIANHESFEDESFIFVSENGNYCFFDINDNKKIHTWDWESDVQQLFEDCSEGGDSDCYPFNGFYIAHSEELIARTGGMEFYELLRKKGNDLYPSIKAITHD